MHFKNIFDSTLLKAGDIQARSDPQGGTKIPVRRFNGCWQDGVSVFGLLSVSANFGWISVVSVICLF